MPLLSNNKKQSMLQFWFQHRMRRLLCQWLQVREMPAAPGKPKVSKLDRKSNM